MYMYIHVWIMVHVAVEDAVYLYERLRALYNVQETIASYCSRFFNLCTR